ncbi:MAG: hypothetical protein ACP5II_03105 [Infirmifilum sp.]|uniref:Metallo-beta-lactamase domain-containing protein n=1 Tax=Infirmifilum uzonense TaxID=1550241 RepID=A0A0F7FHH0_9CREN|nr:hypothetical protein [Infirmifilum uzonense]AKG38743.1 hypothetical protein MA03_04910 [Infirmifilum uzonense]
MIEEIHIDVLVDDIPSVEDLLPLHGLSIYIVTRDDKGVFKRILFDTGPDSKILFKNAETLGVQLKPDLIFGSMPHWHHIGALDKFREAVHVIPSPPLAHASKRGLTHLPGVEGAYVLHGDTHWNEQGLALMTRKGWVVFLGCSVHGLRRTFGSSLLRLGRIWGLIGGLNISTRDNVNLSFLRKLKGKGLQLVMPLHSVSMDARKIILDGINMIDFGYEVSGCGVQSDFSFYK